MGLQLQNAKRIRPHKTSEAVQGPEGPARCGGGGDVPSSGGEASVGLPQGEQAPGPGEQAVVYPGQEDADYLWQGEAEGIWDGQASQGTSGIKLFDYLDCSIDIKVNPFMFQYKFIFPSA